MNLICISEELFIVKVQTSYTRVELIPTRGPCAFMEWVSDGKDDCSNGSDEGIREFPSNQSINKPTTQQSVFTMTLLFARETFAAVYSITTTRNPCARCA